MTSLTAPKESATFRDRLPSALIALFVVSRFGRSIGSLKDSPLTARFAEFAVTFATAALSTVVYTFACGSWWLALGLVGMIFVHEMGHVLAIRLEGLETRAPVFIPLLGAFVRVPELRAGEQEARIAYGGPLVGTLGVSAVFLLALATSGALQANLLIAGLIGTLLNLFNLIIPIRPFDGGRITQIIGGWCKYLGLGVLAALIPLVQSRALILIVVLVLFEFKLPPIFKAVAAALGTLTMLTMVVFRLGAPEPFLFDCANLIAAAAITALFVQTALKGSDQVADGDHDESVSRPVRLKWLGLYFGLIAVLIALMVLQGLTLAAGVAGR